MATKEQYEFFRYLYEEEQRRYGHLEARARLYLSIISLFLATLIFKVEDVRKSVDILGVPWWVVLVQGLLLASALVFVVIGAFIRPYEGVADPEDVVKSFGKKPSVDDSFFDDRIADYVVATSRNAAANNKVARFLTIAVSFLLAAMLLLLVILSIGLAGLTHEIWTRPPIAG
jgi:hypothetical protein